ncbi:MAG: hypothetical protein J6T37_01410 [Bacteroidales bacterium]|nr:hypothetical protein [Bacteroidaceae bacterium]MBO5707692.1 hypothetical protein [Bacteroidaceae bacterium]MBO7528253.1 hypothetical protein [Bacteroidales bacterium]MBO7528514.1 hypothetical protein [Bacteroidales bacterium]
MATREQIIKRANRKVEKLNEYIRECIKECHGETDLYLDNSSTIEGLPEYVEPNYNIKEDGHLYSGDTELCRAIFTWDEDNEDEWEIDDELNEMLKWEKACVRRGVKYFKEYNPDWDDNEEAHENFMNSLDD